MTPANDVTWGLGGRYIYADMTGSSTIALADSHATQQIYNAFLQDQIALIQKSLYLTLGSKFEENTFAGFVPEPSVRLAWYPDNQQTVWGAVSHAVRTPSIVERDFLLNVQAVPGAVLQEQYNHNFDIGRADGLRDWLPDQAGEQGQHRQHRLCQRIQQAGDL